jgi:hypothetical protein
VAGSLRSTSELPARNGKQAGSRDANTSGSYLQGTERSSRASMSIGIDDPIDHLIARARLACFFLKNIGQPAATSASGACGPRQIGIDNFVDGDRVERTTGVQQGLQRTQAVFKNYAHPSASVSHEERIKASPVIPYS